MFENRKEKMIILMGLVSTILTIVLVIIGLSLRWTRNKVNEPTDPNIPPSDNPKMQDEKTDIWYWLGYDDDAPNVTRAVCAGWSGTGTILRYLAYQKDVTIENGRFVKTPIIGDRYADENDFDYLIRKNFGKRRYGYPIVNSLKWLTIDRVVTVDTKTVHDKMRKPDTNDQAPEILTGLTSNTVRRKGLYDEITRPTFHSNVDTKDAVRFSAISTLILDIEDPRPAFEKYPDSLLQNISMVISGFFSSFTIRKDWEEYKSAGDRGHKFSAAEQAALQELLVPFGGEIKQFTLGDPELNDAIQSRFDERATATANAENIKITAKANRERREQEGKGDASYILRTGTAEAMVIKQKAKAMAERLKEYVDTYKQRGASDEDALLAATEMLKTQFGAEAVEEFKGSTLAIGKGAGLFIGTTGGK